MRKSSAQRGAGDCITLAYGVYISRIKQIAPETDNAETNKLATIRVLPRCINGLVHENIFQDANKIPGGFFSKAHVFLTIRSILYIGPKSNIQTCSFC